MTEYHKPRLGVIFVLLVIFGMGLVFIFGNESASVSQEPVVAPKFKLGSQVFITNDKYDPECDFFVSAYSKTNYAVTVICSNNTFQDSFSESQLRSEYAEDL